MVWVPYTTMVNIIIMVTIMVTATITAVNVETVMIMANTIMTTMTMMMVHLEVLIRRRNDGVRIMAMKRSAKFNALGQPSHDACCSTAVLPRSPVT